MRATTVSRLSSVTLFAVAVGVALPAIFLPAGWTGASSPPPHPPPPAQPPRVEGPFAHENLAVYFLREADRVDLGRVITLAQALDEGKVVVRETGDVQALQVENLGDAGVFIEAGDIVKGGQQDRVLTTDLVVPPKSGPMAIDAFCVERGRWSGRGEEPAATFASSHDSLPSRQLKLAAKAARSQGAVWAEVSKLQQKLAAVADAPVTDDSSRTSLQLTLENAEVERGVASYLDALAERAAAHRDVVGFAFAVNGTIVSADVYGAAGLARERWPKALRAAAVEAFASRDEASGAIRLPAADEVARLLARADQHATAASGAPGQPLELEVAGGQHGFQVLESRSAASKLIHRSLVLRDEG